MFTEQKGRTFETIGDFEQYITKELNCEIVLIQLQHKNIIYQTVVPGGSKKVKWELKEEKEGFVIQ